MTFRSKHFSLLPLHFFGMGGGGVGFNYVDFKLTEPLKIKKGKTIFMHM
jgi:hypothetical protein